MGSRGPRRSQCASTVAVVADFEMLPQHGGRNVRVVLKDGRQLEGELIVISGRYQVEWVMFEPWEIETLEDLA